MDDKQKIALLDSLLDYMCEADGVNETIELLRGLGVTDSELREMKFEGC